MAGPLLLQLKVPHGAPAQQSPEIVSARRLLTFDKSHRLFVHLPPSPAMGCHWYVVFKMFRRASNTLKVLSTLLHGNCPRGWAAARWGCGLGGSREAASLQTGGCISRCHLSPWPPASPVFFLLPHGLKLSLSVHEMSKPKRVQPDWTPLPNLRDPSFWVQEPK